MQQKLFPNLKRLTTIFSIAILTLTAFTLVLRLTVFSNATPEKKEQEEQEQERAVDFSMRDEVTFRTDNSFGELRFDYPRTNNNRITIKIIDTETKKTIHETKYLRPGTPDIKMSISKLGLKVGSHLCKVDITVFAPESNEELDHFTLDLVIHMEGDNADLPSFDTPEDDEEIVDGEEDAPDADEEDVSDGEDGESSGDVSDTSAA